MGKVLQLRPIRLERLAESILAACKRRNKDPLYVANGSGMHPAYVEIGRLICESARRDFKPSEIPPALRPCPTVFVIAELIRVFVDVSWQADLLTKCVDAHLAELREGRESTPSAMTYCEQPRTLFEGA